MDETLSTHITSIDELTTPSENILEDRPWAKEMLKTVQERWKKSVLCWSQLVIDMDPDEEDLNSWVQAFVQANDDLGCVLYENIQTLHASLLVKMEKSLNRLQELSEQLGCSIPVLGSKQLSLNREFTELKKKVAELQAQVEDRLVQVRSLEKKQHEVCTLLGIKKKYTIPESPLPSKKYLEEVTHYIDTLQNEIFNREEKFISLKEQIVHIVGELQLEPTSDFERKLFDNNDGTLCISDEEMQMVEACLVRLQRQLKKVKEDVLTLRQELETLWDMLEVDRIERQCFQQRTMGHSLQVLQMLKDEKKHFETLKMANIKIFIDNYRKDLEKVWDLCHCSSEDRSAFPFYDSDCYTEDLLQLFELEIKKWKTYYEKNKKLFLQLNEYTTLWKQMLEMEDNSQGPNRYKNRGGQLLKEEKARNKLSKKIPSLEADLIAHAKNYYDEHGKDFFSFGVTLDGLIQNMHEEREQERKKKLSAHKEKRDKSPIGTPNIGLSLFPSTSSMSLRSATPKSTTKRKIFATPLSSAKKVCGSSSVLGEHNKNTPLLGRSRAELAKSALGSLKKTIVTGRIKRLSGEHEKRLKKRRSSHKRRQQKENESISTEYDQFENELEKKKDCRSSEHGSLVTPSINLIPATPRSGRNHF